MSPLIRPVASVVASAVADPARVVVTGRPFAELLRAHERCESGGRFVASLRGTTAGAPAGYGRSQLNTRNHVELLARLAPAWLERHGTSRADLAALAARGEAAQDWYAAVVGGRRREGSVVGAEDQALVDAVAAKGPLTAADLDVLAAGAGGAFARATGLPADELRFLAATRLLGSASLAREYRASVSSHGTRTAALDAMAARHDGLPMLRARVGDAWIVRYWTDGRLNENRAGWYTRAAMTEDAAFGRVLGALRAGGDALTSRNLWADHLQRSLAAASGLRGFAALGEEDRLHLLGQLARLRALSPVIFEAVTDTRDDLTSVADLQGRLGQLMTTTTAAGAALRAFERALAR